MIKVFRDGRVKLTGVDYAKAKKERWLAQEKRCALCGLFVSLAKAEVDHIRLRGMAGSKRDDRQEAIQIVHGWPCHARRHFSERDQKAAFDKQVANIVEWAQEHD